MAASDYFSGAFQASKSPGLIFFTDYPILTVTAANAAFLKATGTTSEDLLNKSLNDAFSRTPITQEILRGTGLPECLEAAGEGRQQQPGRFILFDSSATEGQGTCWEFETIPLADNDNIIKAYFLSGTDITPRIDLERLSHMAMQSAGEHKSHVALIQNALEEKNSILENIGDGFFRVDKNWIVTYWNNQAEKILGQPREGILTRRLWDVYADAIDSPFFQNYVKAVEEHRTVRFEIFYAPRNAWLEVSAFPSATGLSVYFKDITSRKTAEEHLRDSEEKNRMIMNAALDAIICIDVKGDVIFWNPQATATFGWTSTEVMGNRLSNFIIPEELRHRHDAGLQRYLDTGEGYAFNRLLELNGLNRDGVDFPIELTIVPIRQVNGEFFCAFIRDISGRKKAEENVRRSNERFEKVSEATNAAIWDWDIVQASVYRGNGFNTLFGIEVEKKVEEDFWQDHLHPDDIFKLEESLTRAIEDGNTSHWQMEYRILKPEGKIGVVDDRGIIIRDDNGLAIRMVGAMTDITYRKEYEESLKNLNDALAEQAKDLALSNRELEQFAYVASHDLQEPLRMITGFLKQLEHKYKDVIDDKGKQYIFFAIDGARRMRQIILDLLEFSSVGKWEDRLEMVDMNMIISDTLRLYRKKIEETGAKIETMTLPVVWSYLTPLTQVFQNLISNALKYSRGNTQPLIKIGSEETKTHWQFSVSDNGIGIDREYHEKIFVIFQRLHNKNEFSGTGIGLAIVKKIIINLGGRIWLDPGAVNGTTFLFTIPKSNVCDRG